MWQGAGLGQGPEAFLFCLPDFGLGLLEAEAQEVHVRGRIDDAERAVDLEGVDLGDAVEALREDALEDISGGDVVLDLATDLRKVALEVRGVSLSLPRWRRLLMVWAGPGEVLLELLRRRTARS